jgi:hypothetical protein
VKSNAANKQTRLPSWFKLSNYKEIGKWTLLDWYKHLLARQYCMGAVGPYRDLWMDLNPGMPHPAHEVLKALRLDPLGADKAVEECMASELNGFLPKDVLLNLGVRSLTMSELGAQLSNLNEEKRSAVYLYANLNMSANVHFSVRNRAWLSQTVEMHQLQGDHKHLLEIDLDLPQEILVSQFRDWISDKQAQRSELGWQAIPHAPNIKRWIEMSLLPCMDLMIWAAEESKKLSTPYIARAIHNDGLARESATAKTTIPMARDFLSHGKRSALLLRRLRVEAAAEIGDIQQAAVRRKRRSTIRK